MTASHSLDILFSQRRAGILLHPTSLPGAFQFGDIGHEAFRFIEFLTASGMNVWQMLPLGPTHSDHSPYQSLSSHACDPNLISLDWLRDLGLLPHSAEHYSQHGIARERCLREVFAQFQTTAKVELNDSFDEFINLNHYWLSDYSLFMAIRDHQHDRPWYKWNAALRDRDPRALDKARNEYAEDIAFHQFTQFIFFQQWQQIKAYARQHGVYLFGDLPIYVALDSADVWSNRDHFALDKWGKPVYVAGVPPDFFSETGQLWGNPLYDWSYHQKHHFQWWIERIKTQLALFDLMRIDHFRGLQAYWRIDAASKSAAKGEWVEAPGEALLNALEQHFGHLPLVAEDLGLITEEVHALRKQFQLPGMKVLQFAFNNDANNLYLPHNHEPLDVVYTGTHDNDTTLAWYKGLSHETKHYVQRYLDYPKKETMPWPLIRCALSSVCCMAILPMQDVLGLGKGQRMNTPGTIKGNWQWRFRWEQVAAELAPQLKQMVQMYGRSSG